MTRQYENSADGTPNQPVLFASFNAAAGGDTEIVALVAAKSIRVLSYVINANIAGTVAFESDNTADSLMGRFTMQIGGTVVAPYNPAGWFETVAGEALDLETVTCTADGHITYTLI